MKNILYFLSLACIMLFAGCSSDNDEYTEQDVPGTNVENAKLIVGMGLPGADGTRAKFDNEITKLVWESGDMITAVGFNAQGETCGGSFLYINEDNVGGAEAQFEGEPVKDAVAYRFAYNGEFVKFDVPASKDQDFTVRCKYYNQEQYEPNSFEHIKDFLFMTSDVVPATSTGLIKAGTLNIENSILKVDIAELPEGFVEDPNNPLGLQFFVDSLDGFNMPLAIIHFYCGVGLGNYIYMAFDPAHDLMPGGKIIFEMRQGSFGKITIQDSVNGKNYEPGMIYTVRIDDKWTWMDY